MTEPRHIEPSRMDIAEPHQPKSFLAFLAEQEGGALVKELSQELQGLIAGIEEHFAKYRGKVSGSVALNIKMTLDKGMYRVETEYATRRPKPPPTATVMWTDRDGNLSTMNPRQLAMPFSSISNE